MELTDLFLKLVDMSAAASFVVLAVVIFRFALKKAPRWLHCLMWTLVAVRLICPFSLESSFSLIPAESSENTVRNIMDDYVGSTSVYWDITEEYETALNAGIPAVDGGEGHSYVVTGTTPESKPVTFADVLAPLWAVGMLVMLASALVSYLAIRRKTAASIKVGKNLRLCDHIETPFILGIVRPQIYLPSDIDQQTADHVLAHENAHLKRKDHWWKPLGYMLLTVYWFNPVMWLAYMLLCRDIEMACDEKVVRELDAGHRKAYSNALLQCSVPRHLVAACPLAFGEVGVKSRIKSVLNYRKPAFWVMVLAVTVSIAVAVCFLTDPKEDIKSDIYEQYYNLEDGQAKVMQGTSESDAFLSVTFRSTSGPLKFSVEIWWKGSNDSAWTCLEPVDLTLSDTFACNIPADCTYKVMATPMDGKNGYAAFEVTAGDGKDEEAQPPSEPSIANESISFGIYELEAENAGITQIRLRNLHNGKDTVITDTAAIDSILSFISLIQGTDPTSSRGYYGGTYHIEIQNGSETVFSIGFGDDETFNYGTFHDGYPTRYELQGVSREEVIRFFSQYDASGFDWGLPEPEST